MTTTSIRCGTTGSLFVCRLTLLAVWSAVTLVTASPGQQSAAPKKKDSPTAKSDAKSKSAAPVAAAKEAKRPTDTTKSAKAEPSKPTNPPTDTKVQSAGAATKPAQSAAAKPTGTTQPTIKHDERDQRLADIERRLRELLREVEALRQMPVAQTAAGEKSPSPGILPESWIKTITWRSIGPANMGGRIVDLAVDEKDPSRFWVATASGGLLKTVNNGITFEHQFDNQTTVSIGAVAVSASNPNVVWVGTGENNPRNSVSYGDGVYKSTDGGKTWKNMGLSKTFQIGKIVIHPTNPDIVYVGALGRLYGPNEERGLFKTTDGGASWQKVLFVDANTGVIDLRMHPTDPQSLIAATWERQRDEFDSWPGTEVPRADGYDRYDPIKKWGPGSGLYKTTDGGKTWKKLTKGLPTNKLGRMGIDWHRKDPKIVFAIVDCENIGKGPQPLQAYLGIVGHDEQGPARLTQVMPNSPAAKAGLQAGDVVSAVGDKPIKQFDEILDQLRPLRPGQKVKVSLTRGAEKRQVEITLTTRPGAPTRGPEPGVWLGVVGEDREGRAHLTQVIPDGPAAKAGLQVGDVVLALEGQPVNQYRQLIEQIRGKRSGDKLAVRVARAGQEKEVSIVLENRPLPPTAGPGQQASDVYMGIIGEDVEGGARLTRITEEGPAEKAGLEVGDIIQAVQNSPIGDYAALVQTIQKHKPGDKLQLTVRRGEESKSVEVTLEHRPGGPTRTRPYSFALGGQSPNSQDQQGSKGFEYGGVYRSTDGGESWTRMNSLNSRPMYFSQIRVDPNDDKYVYVLGVAQYRSADGGQTFEGDFGRGVHADGHALWVDPRDGRHMILGTDGGTYVTYDRGANWDHLNHTAIGQFYHVAIAPKQPYRVVGGLQDNGSWLGPSLTHDGAGPINEDWIAVGGGDGFMCRVDPDDPDTVYYTSQDGNMGRVDLRTGRRTPIRPQRARGAPSYRFNWNTPFILSHHNSRIFYCAGNYVFRSLNRGDNLQMISPHLTRTKRGSATALAESPRNPNVLYVGADDGHLWVTRDGGKEWLEISRNVGLPGPRWVSTIEASRFQEGRVYVAFDGHRSNDDEPYVFASDDYGKTWRSLRGNLPWGSTRCLREDVKNPNLLFVGTEFAAWCSIDAGKTWNKLNTNLPTVAVHEFALHAENGELVAATHGRSLWICDISPLRQLKPEHLADRIALFEPNPVVRWRRELSRGRTNRRFVGANPPTGATLYYSLPKKAGRVSVRVLGIDGQVVRELPGPSEPGLHRVVWDLTRTSTRPAGATAESRTRRPRTGPPTEPRTQASTLAAVASPATSPPSATGLAAVEVTGPAEVAAAPPPFGGPFVSARPVPTGTYRVVLLVDGQEFAQVVRVQPDPNAPAAAIAEENEIDNPELDERELDDSARRRIDD